ncbi:MAG: dihydrolipoyl dehydrogenase, partial [Desulfatitalea sp.]|nr:dihydrolipoyl dehydrogenase [Desulfatitalea sp.]
MADTHDFDLIIIGAGPGGYVAAVRAAQLGLKTACIEKRPHLGGVCLNEGCIPSKALLDSSEYFHLAQTHLADHGVKTGKVTLDLPVMMARKEQVVSDLTTGVRKLLEGHRVTVLQGHARLKDAGRVAVAGDDQKTRDISARNILLATGSEPIAPPGLDFDHDRIIDSSDALRLNAVPKQLGIVGGGYIGLELGSVWTRLGAQVTVIEMLPKIGTGLDGQVARTLDRILRRQGLQMRLQTRVVEAKADSRKVKVTVEKNEQRETLAFDRLLVSVGRRPLTRGLDLEALGIDTDPRSGRIQVNDQYRTSVPGVYAIGDLIAGPMLAHKASAEGIAAVENMAGRHGEVNYDAIPSVIYTWPEVASVGLTEEQVREKEIPYCVGSFPFSGAGRARCMGETDGFVKLISHGKTDR